MDALASFNYYGPTPIAVCGSAVIAALFVVAMVFLSYATELAQSGEWRRTAMPGPWSIIVGDAGNLVEPCRLRRVGLLCGLVTGLVVGLGQGQSGGGDLDMAFGVLVRAPVGAVVGAVAGALSVRCGRMLGRRSLQSTTGNKPTTEARRDDP